MGHAESTPMRGFNKTTTSLCPWTLLFWPKIRAKNVITGPQTVLGKLFQVYSSFVRRALSGKFIATHITFRDNLTQTGTIVEKKLKFSMLLVYGSAPAITPTGRLIFPLKQVHQEQNQPTTRLPLIPFTQTGNLFNQMFHINF